MKKKKVSKEKQHSCIAYMLEILFLWFNSQLPSCGQDRDGCFLRPLKCPDLVKNNIRGIIKYYNKYQSSQCCNHPVSFYSWFPLCVQEPMCSTVQYLGTRVPAVLPYHAIPFQCTQANTLSCCFSTNKQASCLISYFLIFTWELHLYSWQCCFLNPRILQAELLISVSTFLSLTGRGYTQLAELWQSTANHFPFR